MSDDEALEDDCLTPSLFWDQTSPSLPEFMALLGHYRRAIYEHYAVCMNQLV